MKFLNLTSQEINMYQGTGKPKLLIPIGVCDLPEEIGKSMPSILQPIYDEAKQEIVLPTVKNEIVIPEKFNIDDELNRFSGMTKSVIVETALNLYGIKLDKRITVNKMLDTITDELTALNKMDI